MSQNEYSGVDVIANDGRGVLPVYRRRGGMVLPLAADKVVFKGKPKKGGADESTAAASAGGVCV